MANSSLIKRLERLEQGDSPGEPPDWVKGWVAQFGGRHEDHLIDGRYPTWEELVSASMKEDLARPETAGGNTDDASAGTDSGHGA